MKIVMWLLASFASALGFGMCLLAGFAIVLGFGTPAFAGDTLVVSEVPRYQLQVTVEKEGKPLYQSSQMVGMQEEVGVMVPEGPAFGDAYEEVRVLGTLQPLELYPDGVQTRFNMAAVIPPQYNAVSELAFMTQSYFQMIPLNEPYVVTYNLKKKPKSEDLPEEVEYTVKFSLTPAE